MARLLSVNVGLPRDIEWNGRTLHTGIWKYPVHSDWPILRGPHPGDEAPSTVPSRHCR